MYFNSAFHPLFMSLSCWRDWAHCPYWMFHFLGLSNCLFFSVTRDSSRRRQWHPTPVLLPGKSHGRRSLIGCNPWGRKESDTTERLDFHFSLSCIGEGNGNPLQCSCLENPRDRGAWWAAVYGVAQSRTWLKWLSSRRINWKKHKLESRLPGEISITSDMQTTPSLWQKVKKN